MEKSLVGIDTNILIDFIQHPLTQDFVLNLKLVREKELCTSKVCVDEARKVLTEKYNLKSADETIEHLLTECKINVLEITERDKNFAKVLFYRYKSKGAHISDMLILANFINKNVRIIVGADYSFQRIIKKAGLYSIKIPNKDKIHEIMFKRSIRFK